jgi:hypothetical protein
MKKLKLQLYIYFIYISIIIMYNLNHDILSIIIPLSTNQNCFLVCKQWYDNFKRNLLRCSTCHKITKIYDKEIWATDDDEYCHEYKGTTEEYKVLKDMIKFIPYFFNKIPKQTHKLCEMAINLDNNNIQYVRNEFKDNKICFMIAKLGYIMCIPKEVVTEDMYIEVVKYNGYLFTSIPKTKITPLICLEAVKKSGDILRHINEQTEELCLEAVRQYGRALEYVNHKTYSICMEAIKQNSSAFKYVPNTFLTEELCLNVVKKDGCMLKYIPNHLLTEEICILAIKNNFHALKYVHNQTENITNDAIKIFRSKPNILTYEFKHLKIQPEDLCWFVLNGNVNKICDIHEPTEEMCMLCVEKDYYAIRFIKNPSDKVCFKALKQSIEAIKYIKNPTIEMDEYVSSINMYHVYNKNYSFEEYIKIFRKDPNLLKKLIL